MPISDLPSPLQQRFKTEDAYTVDLSNYPLNKLSKDDFQALLKVLKANQNLCELNLANCGLVNFKDDELSALLNGLDHLITINLDHNQLSQHSSKMDRIYKFFGALPKLQFFSIDDRVKKEASLFSNITHYVPYLAPVTAEPIAEFFKGLNLIPALRMYKIKKSAVISFLNSSELDTLIQTLKLDHDFALHYMNPPRSLTEFNIDKLIEQKPPFEMFVKENNQFAQALSYRIKNKSNSVNLLDKKSKFVDLPYQMIKALQLFDEVKNNNVSLHYSTDDHVFILDLTQANETTCTQVTRLFKEMPSLDFNWRLLLPDVPISHFAIDAFLELKIKYSKYLNLVESGQCTLKRYIKLETNDVDYVFLNSINELFTIQKADFYNLLNNKQNLFQYFDKLKDLLQKDDEDLNRLICELFMVHHLCLNLDGTNNLGPLRIKVVKQITIPLKNKILALLNFDEEALFQQVTESKITQHSEDYCQALQAKAWWGIAAFYALAPNANEGIYWYGRFLHEYSPQAPHSNSLLSQSVAPASNGLYWIRLAATHYKNPNAIGYLTQLNDKNPSLTIATRYQLKLACDELNIPVKIGCQLTAHHHLLDLFQIRSSFPGNDIFLRGYNYARGSTTAPNDAYKAFNDFKDQTSTTDQLREQEFYLFSLITHVTHDPF